MESGDSSTAYDPFSTLDWLSGPQDPHQFGSFDADALGDIFSHGYADTIGRKYSLTGGTEGQLHGFLGESTGGATRTSESEGSSPFSASAGAYGSSYAPSAGGTADTSFASSGGGMQDLDAFLASSSATSSGFSSHPSPAFSFETVEEIANNLPATFDTSALQSLFADPPPLPAVSSSSSSHSPNAHAHLSPFSAANNLFGQPGQQPMQTFSPAPTVATSTSPLSPYLNAFPQASSLSPGQSFSSSASSASGSGSSPPVSIPRLSVDFGDSSTLSLPQLPLQPQAQAAPPLRQPMTFGAFQHQRQQQRQTLANKPRTSLAATAGVSVPSLLLQPTSNPVNIANSSVPFSFTLKSDPNAPLPLAMLASQHQGGHVPTALAGGGGRGRGMGTRGRSRQQSPVEVIVNAGIGQQGRGVAHQAPLLQLRPEAVAALSHLPAASPAPETVKVKKEKDENAPNVGTAKGGKGTGKGKGGKKQDKGHNAVEQKYRNSINNALATLRDTIPALRHLKPLPSMPATKRKASQFTLASAAVPETPTGLVDGVYAAKTLSKSTILNKAIEYIDFLRSSRDGQNEDLEVLKGMVTEMVGGGKRLVEEFEKRREVMEERRERERQRVREEEGSDAGEGAGEDDEEEEDAPVAPAPAPAKGKKPSASAATSKKRGKKDDAPPPVNAKKARLPTQHITPALTADYRHVQALNAAHLESLASQQQQVQHGYPPSPDSSAEGGVSPAALVGTGTGNSPPRVLLASFMGLSFAGGMSLDWTSSAATAEEAVASAGSAWSAARLVRRSAMTVEGQPEALVDRLHPSLLSGLVALGLASMVVSLVWLLYPLFTSSSSRPFPSPASSSSTSGKSRRRAEALAALAALNDPSSSTSTYGAARASALKARKELLKLAGAPSMIFLGMALFKEAVVAAVREGTGMSFSFTAAGGRESEAERVERAVAWVRAAEIEASVGEHISFLPRCYTFLRLLNLSHSASWPSPTPSPSTSRSAVDALLALHLLSLGHPTWSELLWTRMTHERKKQSDSTESFVDVALSTSFSDALSLLDPVIRPIKADDAPSSPSDTVPLLVLAEAAASLDLKAAWEKLFVGVVGSTTGNKDAAFSFDPAAVCATIDGVYRSTVEGSKTNALAALSKVFLTCFVAGTNGAAAVAGAGGADDARTLFVRLAVEFRQPSSAFARLSAAKPFLQLFLPVFTSSSSASLPPSSATDDSPSALDSTTETDLLATTILEWLLVRKASGVSSLSPSITGVGGGSDVEEEFKVDAALHARALAVRRLLAHEVFSLSRPSPPSPSLSLSSSSSSADGDGEAGEGAKHEAQLDDARDALVDALTRVARKAAGLKGGLWDEDDSGVDL
ncbi:hypothetical protein JCM8547_007397 [Rhodosporidiobolus lusitaniae]